MTIKESLQNMTWKNAVGGILDIVLSAPGILGLIALLGMIFG